MDEAYDVAAPTRPEKSTAWRRIADTIARDVARGVWSSGEALPPAQDLAQQYEVHRHTVRQAYRHLQDLGIINVRQGRGAFVTGAMPYRIGKRVSFRENLGALNIDAKARILSVETITASRNTARDLDVSAGHSLWRLRLVSLASGAPISVSTHCLDARRFVDFPRALEMAEGSFTAAFRQSGITAYGRRSTRISARNAGDDGDVLGIGPDAIVLVARSIDEADGAALQAIETIFRADLIEFLVDGDD